MTELRVCSEVLAAFSREVLKASGSDGASAEASTRAMLHASLHGVDSHGIRLLPFYADSLTTGLVTAQPKLSVDYPSPSAVRVDADGGMGHQPTYRAMDEACAIAAKFGIGMGVVVRSSHFGAAGAYAMAAVEKGFIGFATCNSGAFVVPFGGSKPIHGTSPIAFGAPAQGRDPFLLDMATSSIPWNKVMRYRTEGLPLPTDAAIDNNGKYTDDANTAVSLGALGGSNFGFKGAALAGMAEILAGVLTGMRLSIDQDGRNMGDTSVGHFVMAINPACFVSADLFTDNLARYLDAFAQQPGTMPAGGPEWRRRADRQSNGIPIPNGLYAELAAAGEKAGVPFHTS